MSISNAFKLALQKASNMLYDGTSSGLSATDLQAAIDEAYAKASPISEVKFFARNTAPDGWIKADGSAVSRTTYSALFAVIGTTFGAGDGSTTFNLPDLRGEAIRGWDDGRGVDSGRVFGSSQLDALQGHTHASTANGWGNLSVVNQRTPSSLSTPADRGYVVATSDNTDTTTAASLNKLDVATDGSNGAPRTASETRMRNVALLACIKY